MEFLLFSIKCIDLLEAALGFEHMGLLLVTNNLTSSSSPEDIVAPALCQASKDEGVHPRNMIFHISRIFLKINIQRPSTRGHFFARSIPHALSELPHQWKVSRFPATREHGGYMAFAEFPPSPTACFQFE